MKKIFIAGTDTSIGKTYVTAGLLNLFNRLGLQTIGLKPIASGCNDINGRLYNDDALILQKTASMKLTYTQVNPYAFAPPISPHIASKRINQLITVQDLADKITPIFAYPADICLIEGAGGWLCPINYQKTLADFVKLLELEVILVVGIKLGCLNHALLTYQIMQQSKIKIIGFIANCVDEQMLEITENIETLKTFLAVPCLGIVAFKQDVALAINKEVAKYIYSC